MFFSLHQALECVLHIKHQKQKHRAPEEEEEEEREVTVSMGGRLYGSVRYITDPRRHLDKLFYRKCNLLVNGALRLSYTY